MTNFTQAQAIINFCNEPNEMLSDFDLFDVAEQNSIDALQSRHDAVKFYFNDNSTLYFELKNNFWNVVDLEVKNLAAQ
tara:strand:+ start:720 stop:953 length:234 start_codon:yes stop_codon:yes gene_type:complete